MSVLHLYRPCFFFRVEIKITVQYTAILLSSFRVFPSVSLTCNPKLNSTYFPLLTFSNRKYIQIKFLVPFAKYFVKTSYLPFSFIHIKTTQTLRISIMCCLFLSSLYKLVFVRLSKNCECGWAPSVFAMYFARGRGL